MNDTENKIGRPPKDRPSPLGRRVYELREEKGWTLEVLAEKSGLCVGTISPIERGTREPSLLTAMCLADALGVTLDYLAKGRGTYTTS
jgi:transcriptional regulator with XRE-family HTH domain